MRCNGGIIAASLGESILEMLPGDKGAHLDTVLKELEGWWWVHWERRLPAGLGVWTATAISPARCRRSQGGTKNRVKMHPGLTSPPRCAGGRDRSVLFCET